jgi:hypothetical protein
MADYTSLAGATIVVSPSAHETEQYAAAELARFLFLLTGAPCPIRSRFPRRGTAVVLDAAQAAALGVTAPPKQGAADGFRVAVCRKGTRSHAVIRAHTPAGVLYGVYELLEQLGMGFYAGGETYPDLPAGAELPTGLDIVARPAFRVRGNMLHYNFLAGCTDWGLEDYQFYFDQLARVRCNMLLMHWYDSEPGAAYEVNGEYLAGGRTPNSLSRPWGAIDALRTSEFSFGTGRFFDAEIYSSPMGHDLPDGLTEIKRTEQVFAQATRYARTAGIFEAPTADPTDALVRRRFRSRIRQFLARNPDLTHFALWQHESGGCFGSTPPKPHTAAARLLARERAHFDYLGTDRRVWEAVRFGRFARMASDLLAAEAPHLRLVIVGWGGDRWMRFADLCLAYDKLLPPGVIFTCHDNIDASYGPNVSSPWGELSPSRERWAMPWVEGDLDECWARQPNVESLGALCPDALA